MKRVALHTLGCKLNYAETASIGKQFAESGYDIVGIDRESDIVVINSCSVTSNAERECRQIIRRVLRNSPDAFVAVVGCYAQTQAEQLSGIEGVDFVWGSGGKDMLAEAIRSRYEKREIRLPFPERDGRFTAASSAGFEDRTRAFIKIQDGCDYRCSYCIVPIARGGARSAEMEEVLKEAKRAAEQGYKEIVVTGVNVGEFGRDKGNDLLKLLEKLVCIDGIARIRISSIEPNLLTDDLIDFWVKEEKLCNHWHVPLQSGSDKILGLMGRRYNSGFFRERIEKIKTLVPDAGIGTDVIVGFPGETGGLFEDTYRLLDVVPLSFFHIFSYSERPGTSAAGYGDKINAAVKKERCRTLRELGSGKKRSFLKSFTGKNVNVLLESENTGGIWTGLTGEYVRIDVESGENLKNLLLDVTVTDCSDEKCFGRLELQDSLN
jgi:threonylcarbamoyladenosine tRNA methylthiotransferase MtaB